MPGHVWDAWLLHQFPGRTLEELDGVDVLRLLRATRVQHIDHVEALRKLALDDDASKRLEKSDWLAIRRHDRLMERYGS
jgi:hypothetical protein